MGDKTMAVQIIGVDVGREVKATRFDRKVINGAMFSDAAAREAILGVGLARILKAGVGSEIVLVTQGIDGAIANDLYTIIGIAESGDKATDRMACYLNIDDAQDLLVLVGRVHEIVVIAEALDRVPKITAAIEAQLNDATLEVSPWQVVARSFYPRDAGRQAGRPRRAYDYYADCRYWRIELGADVGAGANAGVWRVESDGDKTEADFRGGGGRGGVHRAWQHCHWRAVWRGSQLFAVDLRYLTAARVLLWRHGVSKNVCHCQRAKSHHSRDYSPCLSNCGQPVPRAESGANCSGQRDENALGNLYLCPGY